MTPDPNAITTRLQRDGWCRIDRISDLAYRNLIAELGKVWCETRVELGSGVQSHLCRPAPVPFHTDHPAAHWTAWRCEAQDETDGAHQLIDGRAALAACGSIVRERLTRVHVEVRAREESPAERVPLVQPTANGERLFFAPWLRPVERDAGSLYAFERLLSELAECAKTSVLEVRLEEGEVLIVDNGRWLHGRRSLPPSSRRRLRQSWIARAAEVQVGLASWQQTARWMEQR
jgi:hypothetical protein